jgi:type II restriction enzyme
MTSDFNWNAPVQLFWEGRDLQHRKQFESGTVDAGTRGAVTGGQHLNALQQAVAELFRSDPDLELDVRCEGHLTLPGYYRRSKNWDLVVLYRGALVAAVEFKSQVGSFGNNFNNRSEEAIGNAADIWRAYEAGLLGDIRPWLGFVMVLEKTHASTTPKVREGNPIFPADPAFNNTGYLDRYRILLKRLVREKQYDAAVVIATERGSGIFDEPEFDLSFAAFTAAAAGRLAYIKALPDGAFARENAARTHR